MSFNYLIATNLRVAVQAYGNKPVDLMFQLASPLLNFCTHFSRFALAARGFNNFLRVQYNHEALRLAVTK